MRLYADTSALAKLIKRESETTALRSWLDAEDASLLSSALVFTELGRLASLAGIPAASVAVLLQRIDILSVTHGLLRAAGTLPAAPGHVLHSLDAIHLASALHMGYDVILTYDSQMTAAAEHHGLRVVAPR